MMAGMDRARSTGAHLHGALVCLHHGAAGAQAKQRPVHLGDRARGHAGRSHVGREVGRRGTERRDLTGREVGRGRDSRGGSKEGVEKGSGAPLCGAAPCPCRASPAPATAPAGRAGGGGDNGETGKRVVSGGGESECRGARSTIAEGRGHSLSARRAAGGGWCASRPSCCSWGRPRAPRRRAATRRPRPAP